MIWRLVLLFTVVGSQPLQAQGKSSVPPSNPNREFVMSCTYGVLAGTLVGAAALAFTDKPGDNLNRVARGASIGLYTGILLGLYVVYIVPSFEANEEEAEPAALMDKLPLWIEPRFEWGQLAGAELRWQVLRF